MITTTNKQILSVECAKKWAEQPEYQKAISRLTAKHNMDFFVAKSPKYALIFQEHLGLFILSEKEMDEPLKPLNLNERKALDRCLKSKYEVRDDAYKAELERLESLPTETKKISVNCSETLLKFALEKCCIEYELVKNEGLPVYSITYNEDFSLVENALKEYLVEFKEEE